MGEMGEMGGDGGGMGGNEKQSQVHHGKCMKMLQQERKMGGNGVEMG